MSYKKKIGKRVQQNIARAKEIQEKCNAVLKCLGDCTRLDKSPEVCEKCGNPDCLMAFMDLEELWKKC